MKVFGINPESIESQPQNAELSRFNSFSDYFSGDLNTINYLNLKLFIFVGILQVLKFKFLNIRILENLNFNPCVLSLMFRKKKRQIITALNNCYIQTTPPNLKYCFSN